jgi:hypothetical protein
VPRPKGSADLLSDRRRRALTLLKSGLSLNGCPPNPMRGQFRDALVECLATKRCSEQGWRDTKRHLINAS